MFIAFRRPSGLVNVELRPWLAAYARVFDALSGSLSCGPDTRAVSSTDELVLRICLSGERVAAVDAGITELVADMRLLGLRPSVIGGSVTDTPGLTDMSILGPGDDQRSGGRNE